MRTFYNGCCLTDGEKQDMKNAIVMAAGKGTRMKSDTPKVLHQILGVPMAELIVHSLREAGADRIVTVTGYRHEEVEKALAGQCEFALQEPQLGTGHAVMQARQLAEERGVTLVINGDAPTIQPETLQRLFESIADADMSVLTVKLDDAGSYGRIVRGANGEVERIVEAKDATPEEKKINEINTGIYAFNNEKLFAGLKELRNDNAQKEYVEGVNDNVELARASKWLQHRINEKWMKAGVTMIDPDTTYIGPYVTFGHDVVIHPCTEIYGSTYIGNHVTILGGSTIVDTNIEDNTTFAQKLGGKSNG